MVDFRRISGRWIWREVSQPAATSTSTSPTAARRSMPLGLVPRGFRRGAGAVQSLKHLAPQRLDAGNHLLAALDGRLLGRLQQGRGREMVRPSCAVSS